MLAQGGDASHGRALTVGDLDPDTPYQGQFPQMLGRLIRYEPELARQTVGWIAEKAESRLGIPRPVVDKSLQIAIFIDGDVGKELADEFFYRASSPPPATSRNEPELGLASTWGCTPAPRGKR